MKAYIKSFSILGTFFVSTSFCDFLKFDELQSLHNLEIFPGQNVNSSQIKVQGEK